LIRLKDDLVSVYESEINGLEFKHQYSAFLDPIMNEIDDDALDVMVSNLEKIINICVSEEVDSHIIRKMVGLRDHIKLDVVRYGFFKKMDVLDASIEKLKTESDKISSDIDGSRKILEALGDEFKDSGRKQSLQIVSVLGIFTTIVLAFTGGLNFLTGSISGIETVDVFKLVLIVLLCGFILYNLVAVLLHVVCVSTGNLKLTFEPKFSNPVFMVNLSIMIFIVIDLIMW
jgi:hypothetical protein